MAAIWGRICCLPCEACGKLCELSCRACSGACEACGNACSEFEKCLCPPNRPSPIFLTFTVMFAGVPGLVSLFVGLVNITKDCDESLALFLLLQVRFQPRCPSTQMPHSPLQKHAHAHVTSATFIIEIICKKKIVFIFSFFPD